jgi:hypothetical protein
MTRLRNCVVAAGLVLVAVVAVQAQDKDQAFKDGVAARKRSLEARDTRGAKGHEEWADVIGHMQRAIQASPTESTKTVGSKFFGPVTEYLPHFFLGEARHSLGDCVGAMDAWSRSERQGAVQKADKQYSRTMETGYRLCEEKGLLRPAKFDAAVEKGAEELEEAFAAFAAFAAASGRRETAGDLFNAERRSRLAQGSADLEQAKALRDAAKRSHAVSDFNELSSVTSRAAATLSGLTVDLDAAISAREAARAELLIAAARDAADAVNSKAVAAVEIQPRTRPQGRGARGGGGTGPSAEVSRAPSGPLSLSDLDPALLRGSQLFRDGNYQQALDALNPAAGFSPNMPLLGVVQVHLYRAAALHALSLKSRTANASLRMRASAEAGQVKALNPDLQPDPRTFSPRFREFFRESVAAAVVGSRDSAKDAK